MKRQLRLSRDVIIYFTLANGSWAEWNPLTKCADGISGCTGNITYVRTRTCTDPEPFLGGDYCPGNDTQVITQGTVISHHSSLSRAQVYYNW